MWDLKNLLGSYKWQQNKESKWKKIWYVYAPARLASQMWLRTILLKRDNPGLFILLLIFSSSEFEPQLTAWIQWTKVEFKTIEIKACLWLCYYPKSDLIMTMTISFQKICCIVLTSCCCIRNIPEMESVCRRGGRRRKQQGWCQWQEPEKSKEEQTISWTARTEHAWLNLAWEG